MDTLNKKIILYAVSALALTATTGFLLQTESYVGLKKEFNTLFKSNEKNKAQLKEQALLIDQMGEEIQSKDDSITVLNTRIGTLASEVQNLKNKVRSLSNKLNQKNDKLIALNKQINKLKNSSSANNNKIAQLSKERDELLERMEELDKIRYAEGKEIEQKESEIKKNNHVQKQLKDEIAVAQEKLERTNMSPSVKEPAYAAPAPSISSNPSMEEEKEKIIKARKQARVSNIVKNTTIEFRSVELKEGKNAKRIDKLKGDGWRYAVIEFDLKNADGEAIFDEEFYMQIFDLDNQKVIPVNESNPQFPNSEMGAVGYKFTYEGDPLKIDYFNSQKKTGKNYEVRLFYAGNGFLIPITNGKNRIVNDGLVAER